MKILKYAALTLAALILAVAAWDLATYSRAAWTADYGRIKRGMAQNYANLDWIEDHRGLDLAALDRRTQARIDGAWSRIQAALALRDFIAAFGDPHLQLEPGSVEPASPAGATDGEQADPPAGADCGAAGFSEDEHGFAAPFASVAGWTQVQAGDFPTGMIGDSGVIRISSFGEDRYEAACTRVFRPGMRRRALQLAVRAELQRELIAAIDLLRSRGARRILVDLTGNGGGSEWDREAASLFTARTMRRREPGIANPACDRRLIWTGARPCPIFSGPPQVTTLEGTGAWTGPVLVLVDGRTASAAEEFAGWLRDNRLALLIGERTLGAGCGYVNGGAPVGLRAAPLVVKMPNCARFTAEGVNEIEGWRPDIALPSAEADAQAWANRLRAALAAGA